MAPTGFIEAFIRRSSGDGSSWRHRWIPSAKPTSTPPSRPSSKLRAIPSRARVGGCDVVAIRGEEPPVSRRAEDHFLLAAGLPGNRAAGRRRRRLPRDSAVFETHRPQERCSRAVPSPRARASHRTAPAHVIRGGAARSGGVSAAAARIRARTAAAGVPAPGGRSQRGRLHPAPDHDRVPAGCPALCRVPRRPRSDESRRRGRRGRRRSGPGS